MASFAATALLKIQPQHGAGQHSLAAEAKLLATQVSTELQELKLWRIWKFVNDLDGLIAFLASFLHKEDAGPTLDLSHYTTADSEVWTPSSEENEGITEEAQGILAKASGLNKFRIYKSLDVATDSLFTLESLLGWPVAGQMACALQRAIGDDLHV